MNFDPRTHTELLERLWKGVKNPPLRSAKQSPGNVLHYWQCGYSIEWIAYRIAVPVEIAAKLLEEGKRIERAGMGW